MKIHFNDNIFGVQSSHWRRRGGADSPSQVFMADFPYFRSAHTSKLTVVHRPVITSLSMPIRILKGWHYTSLALLPLIPGTHAPIGYQ